MKKKHFYQRLWFWLIIVGILLLGGNVAVLLGIQDTNIKSAWLTLISGWVSGVATIILGLIAVWQNYNYSFESKKNNLYKEISEYSNDLQLNFLTHINLDHLYKYIFDLDHNINEKDKIKKYSDLRDIVDRERYFITSFMKFETIFYKSIYCASEIIELEKSIDEMCRSFYFINIADKKNLSIKKINSQIETHISNVREWTKNVAKMQDEIILKLEQLKTQILNAESRKSLNIIEQDILDNRKRIHTHFEQEIKDWQSNG